MKNIILLSLAIWIAFAVTSCVPVPPTDLVQEFNVINETADEWQAECHLVWNADDGKFIIYSFFMIDQYDYQPAYKDLLPSLIKYYEGHRKRPLGKKALLWLQELLMENQEDINDDIFKETTSAILSYSIQDKKH